jgi:hypothetical protein
MCSLAGRIAMAKIDKSEQIDHSRRRLFGAAAVSAAVAQLGLTRSAPAQTKSSNLPAIKPGANTSFGPLKQIDAGDLNVGYAEAGPANGSPVILLHGWPYDIMLRRYWRRPAIASSCRLSAVTAPRDFCPTAPFATGSPRRSPSILSP